MIERNDVELWATDPVTKILVAGLCARIKEIEIEILRLDPAITDKCTEKHCKLKGELKCLQEIISLNFEDFKKIEEDINE